MSDLLKTLNQFTGTEKWYKHPLYRKFTYTDGVQYLAKKAGAYWFVEYIFSNQHDRKIKNVPFQTWIIKVRDDNTAIIRVEDGNKKLIKRFRLNYTDFPLKEFTLWFTNNVLLLPNEY